MKPLSLTIEVILHPATKYYFIFMGYLISDYFKTILQLSRLSTVAKAS